MRVPRDKRRRPRAVGIAAGVAVCGVLLTACVATAPDPGDDEAVAPTSPASEVLPAPGRTIEAVPEEPADLHGYRIAVVVPDDTRSTQNLLAAAREFAADTGATLAEFAAPSGDADPVGTALAGAVESGPDLVVGLGDGVVPVFDIETAKILAQQVLIVGAQLAEPTHNVTAVIWDGATSREAEPDVDGLSVTVQRGRDALAVGVASVLDDVTGVVLHLPH